MVHLNIINLQINFIVWIIRSWSKWWSKWWLITFSTEFKTRPQIWRKYNDDLWRAKPDTIWNLNVRTMLKPTKLAHVDIDWIFWIYVKQGEKIVEKSNYSIRKQLENSIRWLIRSRVGLLISKNFKKCLIVWSPTISDRINKPRF